MARAIGREPTDLPSRTKAPRDRGYMPTCIARKAIREKQRIGTTETRPSENEMKGIPQLEAVFAECATVTDNLLFWTEMGVIQ
jgi:hypothetical protein